MVGEKCDYVVPEISPHPTKSWRTLFQTVLFGKLFTTCLHWSDVILRLAYLAVRNRRPRWNRAPWKGSADCVSKARAAFWPFSWTALEFGIFWLRLKRNKVPHLRLYKNINKFYKRIKIIPIIFSRILPSVHRRSQGIQGGHAPPQISSIPCHFALWEAVSQTTYCCSLKVKRFSSSKTFGQATPPPLFLS